jgi:HEAT repeat protein
MLAKSLESKDAGERESALYALRQIGPKAAAATRPLYRRMQADNSFDSLAAAWALVRVAPGNAKIAEALVPKLSGSLNNADEVVRLESAAALGEMGAAAKGAAKDLEHTSKNDSSDSVRETAAEALKQVQS